MFTTFIGNAKRLVIAGGFFLVACVESNTPPMTDHSSASKHFKLDWAGDKLWDDGKAEVGLYEAKRVIYGKVRDFEYVYILVKETFNKAYNVKTDYYERDDLFAVMKLNMFAKVQTENYPFHCLTSIFFKREQPIRLHKMTSSSQEWCGNTFKLFLDTGNVFKYVYHSYWDQEGDGTALISENVLFEDQLPYTLRALRFSHGLEFKHLVLASQISNKAKKPKIYQATFLVAKETNAVITQDSIIGNTAGEAWKVTVKLMDNKVNQYWFSGKYPNYLLKQVTWDGKILVLKNISRKKYWIR